MTNSFFPDLGNTQVLSRGVNGQHGVDEVALQILVRLLGGRDVLHRPRPGGAAFRRHARRRLTQIGQAPEPAQAAAQAARQTNEWVAGGVAAGGPAMSLDA